MSEELMAAEAAKGSSLRRSGPFLQYKKIILDKSKSILQFYTDWLIVKPP